MNGLILNSLPDKAQDLFNEVYITERKKGFTDSVSTEVAWTIVKSRLNEFTAQLYTFSMSDTETKVIMNSENEEIVIEAILADNTANTDGKFFTETELIDIATQINTFGTTLPDVDHEKLKGLVQRYGNNVEAIKAELQREKGIFKTIKAVVEKGKLWIQAALDKRYKNHTEKFKKLSIEAVADKGENGRLINPKYLGFTFTNVPKLLGADIVSVSS